MAYKPAAVANAFLGIAEARGDDVTPMKLQKLVYFAHGWHLAFTEEPLIDEPVEAWKYGPVIESLYHQFKGAGNSPIRDRATIIDFDGENVRRCTPELPSGSYASSLVEEVWRVYGKFSATQLSNMTHAPGSPWSVVAEQLGGDITRNVAIPDEIIHGHFVKLNEKAG